MRISKLESETLLQEPEALLSHNALKSKETSMSNSTFLFCGRGYQWYTRLAPINFLAYFILEAIIITIIIITISRQDFFV